MQIEKQKIDHVTVQEPVGQIAQDPGEQQRERNITPRIARMRSAAKAETTKTSATHESTIKKRLLFLKEPKAAPVFVT